MADSDIARAEVEFVKAWCAAAGIPLSDFVAELERKTEELRALVERQLREAH